MTENAGGIRVRCPNPECRKEFGLTAAMLGKGHPCPACGHVATVVPIAVRERAEAERARAGSGDVSRNTMPVTVVLENIRSLWNVGSIFRTADAAGAEEIVLAGYTGRPPRAEIAKTALGAEQVVPWREAATAGEAIEELRGRGCSIIALDKTDDSVPLADADVAFPCAVLLGNEVVGLSDEAIQAADLVCHLPMHGLKSSLNVAVAAGVALYEVRRKAEQAGVARTKE